MLILLIIIKILLYLLLFLLGLGLLLLIIPISYSGRLITDDGFRAQVAVGWAWSFLGINAEVEGDAVFVTLRVFGKKVYRLKSRKTEVEEDKTQQEPEAEEKEKKSKSGFSIKDIIDKSLINVIIDYFKRVISIVKPKYLHLYGTYGFEDPSITGALCGITGIIKGLIPHARLELTPDFTREVIELDMKVEGSMVAGTLVYQTIRTAFKKPVRKLWFRKKKVETFFK